MVNKTRGEWQQEVSDSFAKLPGDVRKDFNPSRSQIVERSMRCGVEARMWHLKEAEDIEQVALYTLKEDFVRSANDPKSLYQYNRLIRQAKEKQEAIWGGV